MLSLMKIYKHRFKIKITHLAYILAFFTPICILLFLYWRTNIEPFGNNTVASGDMINQYLALISYYRNNIFHIGNLIYSYQISLGSNFFSVWTYYLSSPFNVLAVFFKSEQIPLFFELNTFFDAGLASLLMAVLLNKSYYVNYKTNYDKNVQKLYAAAFGTMYALMSFIFAYKISIFWYNAIALMPLVILGFEKLVRGKNPTLYWVALSLLIIINYYIGIMVVLFIFIMSVFFIINEFLNKKKIRVIFLKGLKILWLTILTLMISSIVLLPSILGQSDVAKEPFNFKFDYIYQPFHLIAGLFTRSHFQDSPIIYTSLMVTLLVFIYFRIETTRQKDKNLLLAFLVTLFISTWLNTFYMMWHGFTMPNGYINREAFLIAFVLIIMGYKTLGLIYNQQKNNFKTPLWILITILLVLVQVVNAFSGLVFLINLLGLVIGTALIELIYHGYKPYLVFLGFLLFVLCDITYSNFPITKQQAKISPQKNAYQSVVQTTNQTLSRLRKKDNSFYRVGSSFELNPNDPLQFNYAGISSYVSQQPTEATDYMSALGYYQKHGWTRWARFNNGSTLFMDSLLGVKYILSATNGEFNNQLDKTNNSLRVFNARQPLQYDTIFLKEANNLNVYKNNHVFPLAFTVNKNAKNLSLNYETATDPFKIQNSIWAKAFGLSEPLYNNQNYQKNIKNNVTTCTFTTSHTGLLYLYMPTQKWVMWPVPLKLICNGQNIMTLFKNNEGENGIVCLGRFNKGKKINLTLTTVGNNKANTQQLRGIPNISPYISIENDKLLDRVRSKQILNDNVKIKKISGPSIILETNKHFKKNNILVTIPYDSSWHSKVDGKKTNLNKALGHLMMVKVPKGKHKIEFKYSVKGLNIAIFLSIVGLILSTCSSMVYVFKYRRVNRDKNSKEL